MGPLSDQRPTVDEVEQHRKYAIEEQDPSPFKTRAAMALIFGSAIGLLKNVLFSEDAKASQFGAPEAAEAAPWLPPRDDVGDRAGSSELPATREDGAGTAAPAESAAAKASARAQVARSRSQAPVDDGLETHSSGEIPQPSNDNETLYGAKPGSNIAAFPGAHRGDGGDSLGVARPHGPGPGGGAPSGSDDNDLQSTGSDSDPETTGSGFPGADENDEKDGSDPQGRPNRPSAVTRPVQLAGLFVNQSVIIGLSDLLAHASDADGDSLTVQDLAASSGTLDYNGNDTWTFTPDGDDTSGVLFTYNINDGEASTPQTASLDLLPPVASDIVGTEDAHTLIGTPGSDTIASLAGEESVQGGDGDDLIQGGDGDDQIGAGAGNDLVFAGTGNDVVFGGPGDDVIFGGPGVDLLFGEEGDDELYGEDGDDTLSGGPGDDMLAGGAASDKIDGGSGDDLIIATTDDGDDDYDGGTDIDSYDLSLTSEDAAVDLASGSAASLETGTDRIRNIENVIGGQGNDVLIGDDATNVLTGGAGDDKLVAAAGADEVGGNSGDDVIGATIGDGDDSYVGGADTDTYDLSATSADAVVDLASGSAASLETGHDVISGFENVTGGGGNDVLIGDDATNVLTGGDGDDKIIAGAGDDEVSGESGDDVVGATIGDGNDTYDGGADCDTYDLSATSADAVVDLASGSAASLETGHDDISGFENVTGGGGNDVIIADDAKNVLMGGEGNDTFVFLSTSAIGKGEGHRDQILDFEVGDRIRLSEISDEVANIFGDALADLGIRKFVLIGDDGTFTAPGQLRIKFEQFDDRQVTVVAGNIDDDAETEFEIELYGQKVMTDEDFS